MNFGIGGGAVWVREGIHAPATYVQDASNAATRTSSETAATSIATPSTVNGRTVRKVLPDGNGHAKTRR